MLSSGTQENSAKSPMPQPSLAQHPTSIPPKPNYDPFSSLSSQSHPTSRSTTPASTSFLQASQPPPPSQTPSDPFASLSSTASRHASPLPQQFQVAPSFSPASLFDSDSPAAQSGQVAFNSDLKTNGAPAEEDWDFASALPDDGLPLSNEIMVSKTSVNITFEASRPEKSRDAVAVIARFSNNTPSLITEYTFQVAVTKV